MWPFSVPGASELLYMTDNLKLAKQLLQSTDRELSAAATHAFSVCKQVCKSYSNALHKECWTCHDFIQVSKGLNRILHNLSSASALGRAQNNTSTTMVQSLCAKAKELLEARDRTATLVLSTDLPLHRLKSYTFREKSGMLSRTKETSASFFEETLPVYNAGALVKFKDG